jgi:very-short-patch-repair endonuclease
MLGTMAHAHRFDALMGTEAGERGADAAIAAVAERQHGVITRAQLLEIGVGSRAVTHRLARRRLHPLHRGVYAVGHSRVGRDGGLMAAVLASGSDAVLSHRSAAAVWGIRRASVSGIEVTVPRDRQRPGIRLYQSAIPPDERNSREGIPVTSVPRTLLDLAAVLPPGDVERAFERAEVLRLHDALSLPDLLDRYPRRPGTRALRAILATRARGETITRSELEERFLSFLAGSGLPRPRVNASVSVRGRRVELDFLWPDARVVVELDGYATHGTRAAFEDDRARDRLLLASGLRPVRVTWRHLHDDAARLERDLRALLSVPPVPSAGGRAARRFP